MNESENKKYECDGCNYEGGNYGYRAHTCETPSSSESWEKEFDKEFSKRGGWYEKNTPFDCWEAFDGLRVDIKSFIKSLLSAKEAEIEEKKAECLIFLNGKRKK